MTGNRDHHPTTTHPTPLMSLRRHWPVAAVIVPIAALLGGGFGFVQTPTYTAETRIAVGAGELSTFAVPGFPLAARELAANYARWVHNNFADETFAPDQVSSISASPIPETNVIRIEATSPDQDVAIGAAAGAATRLRTTVNEAQQLNDPATMKNEHKKLAKTAAQAESKVTLIESELRVALTKDTPEKRINRLKDELAKLREEAEVARLEMNAKSDQYRRAISQPTTAAELQTISPAAIVKNNRMGLIQRWGMLGAGLGVALSLLIAVLIDRRRAARPDVDEPAALTSAADPTSVDDEESAAQPHDAADAAPPRSARKRLFGSRRHPQAAVTHPRASDTAEEDHAADAATEPESTARP